jgi:hypothetical protein
LEPLAQYIGDGGYTFKEQQQPSQTKCDRKLVLPEMVFPLAHVVLEYNANNNAQNEDDDEQEEQEDSNTIEDLFIAFNAIDALKEWSMAHQSIKMPQRQQQQQHQDSSNKLDGIKPSDLSYRGVQVLESSDAALWKQRQQQAQPNNTNDDERNSTTPPNVVDQGTISNTQFHYDWTYNICR